MNLQFIRDNQGNTTGVFITIEEWQTLKQRYAGLQKEEAENTINLSEWQKQLLDDRLNTYYQSTDFQDFDKTINDAENML